MEQLAVEYFLRYPEFLKSNVTGLAFGGGLAYNSRLNTGIRIAARRLGLQVHVPAAAGDEGQGLGAAMLVARPRLATPASPYLGYPVPDRELLPQYRERFRGSVTTPAAVADLLHDGRVVQLLRGRRGFGPWVYGHSTVVAAPTPDGKRALRRIAGRRWYENVPVLMTNTSAAAVLEGTGSDLRCRECFVLPCAMPCAFSSPPPPPERLSSAASGRLF